MLNQLNPGRAFDAAVRVALSAAVEGRARGQALERISEDLNRAVAAADAAMALAAGRRIILTCLYIRCCR